MNPWPIVLVSALVAAACGSAGDGIADAGRAQSAPKFLDLTVTPATITELTLVNVEATVVDDDGDLASGRLETEDGVSIGLLTAVSSSGFALALSWQMLHSAEPIEFVGTSTVRMLYVRFIDRAEHATRMPFELRLACESGGACNGTCKYLARDPENCGACGHACDPSAFECDYGLCPPAPSQCVATMDMRTCGDVCAAQGGTCSREACDSYFGPDATIDYYDAELCDPHQGRGRRLGCDYPMDPTVGAYARCCCHF